jgi:microcystin-dependent protein
MLKHLKSLFAPALVALLTVSAAHGAFYQWSKTAASNATADSSINWSEGMSPSSVNDSARAMMARAAEYRDDISGSITTGGTLTAYTVTTNQGLASTPTDGQLLAFTPHATSGVAPTLTVDGGTTYAIQTSPGVAVGAATLVLGTPYTVKFSTTDSAWILRDFYGNPYAIPIGGMMPYTGSTAPNSNFVLPYGQCISRTTYATYFAQVSTTFGVCDGTTTFGVPDLRGRSLFGVDNMGGTAANRITVAGGNFNGSVLGTAGGNQTKTLALSEIPTGLFTMTDPGHLHNIGTQDFFTAGSGVGTNTSTAGSTVKSATNTTGITLTDHAGGGSFGMMPPAMVVNFILRVI